MEDIRLEVKCWFKITFFVYKSSDSFGIVLSLKFCLYAPGQKQNNKGRITIK